MPIKTDFFPDTANFPYGTKKRNELEKIIQSNLKYLAKRKNKYIAIACNTASIAGRKIFARIEKQLSVTIFPITLALTNAYSDFQKTRKIMIIGTNYTIESGYYQAFVRQLNDRILISSQSEQELVVSIEVNRKKQVTEQLKRLYRDIQRHSCDSLLIGCTHYSLIKDKIQKMMPGVKIIDPAYCLVEAIIKELIREKKDTYQKI